MGHITVSDSVDRYMVAGENGTIFSQSLPFSQIHHVLPHCEREGSLVYYIDLTRRDTCLSDGKRRLCDKSNTLSQTGIFHCNPPRVCELPGFLHIIQE